MMRETLRVGQGRTFALAWLLVLSMALFSCSAGSISYSEDQSSNRVVEGPTQEARGCTDRPPKSDYPCQQQADANRCEEAFMQGYCDLSCGRCQGDTCEDLPPDSPYICAQLAGMGKCADDSMQGLCDLSCGRCDKGVLPGDETAQGAEDPNEALPLGVDTTKWAECGAVGGGGGQFLKAGPYGYKTGIRGLGPFTYVPKNFGKDGCKYPVIAFSMGTSAPSFVYTGYYTFFASWGFVVVVDPTMMGQMTGGTIKSAIDWLYRSEYAPYLSTKAGTIGHSQGGGGAFNAGPHQNVAAIVGLEPGQFPGPFNKKPYLGLAGTLDMFGMGTNPLLIHWGLSSGPKFYANLAGADHIFAPLNTGNGTLGANFRAAATAWFRCYLSSDQEACALFKSGRCDKLAGRWADCKADKI